MMGGWGGGRWAAGCEGWREGGRGRGAGCEWLGVREEWVWEGGSIVGWYGGSRAGGRECEEVGRGGVGRGRVGGRG